MDYGKESIKLHRKYKGKIEIKSKVNLKNKDSLALYYTPGVASVSEDIFKDKNKSWELTNRSNQIAIVCDGSAVLGLGNVGPEAGMPVMEGKSVILKEYAGIDAFPLCINAKETEEIINFCKYIEPSFAGINLEDISAPRCFEILERLEKELKIPVFHDDQDGTAIVILAALINSCRVLGKVIKDLKIVINGAGAAGIAVARLLITQGVKNILLVDSKGIVCRSRKDLNKYKKDIAKKTNKNNIKGDLVKAMQISDVFIGVSKGNLVNEKMVKSMNKNPIIFAIANPIPEIFPEEAHKAGAAIVGTGRSDYPNQINNALVFPGIFRGLLNDRSLKITEKIKIKVAIAIAYSLKKPHKDNILPKISDKMIVKKISEAMKK